LGLRAGLDRCGKPRPPPGFNPHTIQPVGSRYTDYATWPIMKIVHAIYYLIAEWNLYCAVRVGCLKSHLMMELFLPCILTLQILLGICMVVKSACSVRHICLSAHVIVAPTGQIFMKFDLQTCLKSYKYIRHFL
jgi:hypothetical protein